MPSEWFDASLGEVITLQRGYPPDKQEKATQTVLEQAELIAADWALADARA